MDFGLSPHNQGVGACEKFCDSFGGGKNAKKTSNL